MVKQLRWSLSAIEDIEQLASYIEKSSPFYAKALVEKIFLTVESLPEFPYIGRIVPEIYKEDYRERFVHKFRIIYKITDTSIIVLAVIHGHQDLVKLLPSITTRS